VVTDNTYGGTYRLFERVLRKYQLDFSYVDTSDLSQIQHAIRPNTKMLFLETPTNPTLRLTDLPAACELAHARGVFVVVDNTFASPYVQRPIDFGDEGLGIGDLFGLRVGAFAERLRLAGGEGRWDAV